MIVESNVARLRAALSTSPQELCDSCKKFNVLGLLALPRKEKIGTTIACDKIEKLLAREWCPTCRLLAIVLPRLDKLGPSDLNITCNIHAIHTTHEGRVTFRRKNVFPRSTITLEAGPCTPDLCSRPSIREWWSYTDTKEIERVRHGLENFESLLEHGRLVSDTEINWTQVKRWLELCDAHHTGHCDRVGNSSDDVRPLRVMDAIEECVIETPKDAKWAALSYTWGDKSTLQHLLDSQQSLFTPGSFSRISLPSTIADALLATKRLGLRYLWVDCTCIDQQNLLEKAEEISNLNSIFARATLTLVALDGSDASSGLPGVRPMSRSIEQHFAHIPGRILMTAQPSLEIVLRERFWSTRGWTYQEQILSVRCLYFSKSGIYWECQAERWIEDVNLEAPSNNFSSIPPSLNPPSLRGFDSFFELDLDKGALTAVPDNKNWSFDDLFTYAVFNYKNRNLSHDIDILAAFSGIISVLARANDSTSICGLPVFAFYRSLCWGPLHQTVHPAKQRGCWKRITAAHHSSHPLLKLTGHVQLPSWTWAGWTSEEASANTSFDPDRAEIATFQPVVSIFCADSRTESPFEVGRMAAVRSLFGHASHTDLLAEAKNAMKKALDQLSKPIDTIYLLIHAEIASLESLLKAYTANRWHTSETERFSAHADVTEEDIRSISVVPIMRSIRPGGIMKVMKCLLVQHEGPIAYRLARIRCPYRIWLTTKKETKFVVLA